MAAIPVASVEAVAAAARRSEPVYTEFLRVASLSAGVYVVPVGTEDRQSPHGEDEVYMSRGVGVDSGAGRTNDRSARATSSSFPGTYRIGSSPSRSSSSSSSSSRRPREARRPRRRPEGPRTRFVPRRLKPAPLVEDDGPAGCRTTPPPQESSARSSSLAAARC